MKKIKKLYHKVNDKINNFYIKATTSFKSDEGANQHIDVAGIIIISLVILAIAIPTLTSLFKDNIFPTIEEKINQAFSNT